jgi:hypothetical protein
MVRTRNNEGAKGKKKTLGTGEVNKNEDNHYLNKRDQS